MTARPNVASVEADVNALIDPLSLLVDTTDADYLHVLRCEPHNRKGEPQAATKSWNRGPDGSPHKVAHSKGTYHTLERWPVWGIKGLARCLDRAAADKLAWLIRGEWTGKLTPCGKVRGCKEPKADGRYRKTGGDPAFFTEKPRCWFMADFDKRPNPEQIDVAAEPERAIRFLVNAMPEYMRKATCYWQLSSSAGMDGGKTLSAHVFYWFDRAIGEAELKAWIVQEGLKGIIDDKLCGTVQPHFIAAPVFNGVPDPIKRRSGLLKGETDVVALPAIDLAPARVDTFAGSSDGLQTAPGFENKLAEIGDDHDGFQRPIFRAICSYVWEHGAEGTDKAALKARIREAIASAYKAPGRAKDDIARYTSDAYLDKEISNAVRKFGDGRKAAGDEFEVIEEVEPSWKLPTLAVNEAAATLKTALAPYFGPEVVEHRERLLRHAPALAAHEEQEWLGYSGAAPVKPQGFQVAAVVGAGIGKTHLAAERIVKLVKAHPDMRVAYAVPSHALGSGIMGHFERLAPGIAREWHGREWHIDGQPMCRQIEAVKTLVKAGGSADHMCGSAGRGFCPFHPKAGGGCPYIKQREARSNVWVVPSSMLPSAMPAAMKRKDEHADKLPAFDLLVIDENPFLGYVHGTDRPFKVDVAWLHPAEWAAIPDRDGELPGSKADQVQRATGAAWRVLSKLKGKVSLDPKAFEAEGISPDTCREVRLAIFRTKIDADKLVTPTMTAEQVASVVADVTGRNVRVLQVARFWEVLADLLSGKAARLQMVKHEDERADGAKVPVVMLAWRDPIHEDWEAPVVYLDATGNKDIALSWLPRLKVVAEAAAAAPFQTVRQVHNRAMSYRMVAPDPTGKRSSKTDQAAQQSNAQHLLNLIALRARQHAGGEVLVICPKALHAMWEDFGANGKVLPGGWRKVPANVRLLHHGETRGRSEFENADHVMIVSRPLPGPAAIEKLASVVFGRDVAAVDGWYPKRPVGRLMADGTGRRFEAVYHPDPACEAVRLEVCEHELVQEVGRARGVRRTADRPVSIEVVTNVPLPGVPVNELVRWEDLRLSRAAVALVREGVLPLAPKHAAKAFPDLWETAKAAECDLSDEVEVCKHPSNLLRDITIGGKRGVCTASFRSHRTAPAAKAAECDLSDEVEVCKHPSNLLRDITIGGKRGVCTASFRSHRTGPAARAVVAPWCPDPRGTLERLLGSPVAEFAVERTAPLGFDEALALLGDGPALEGFNQPVRAAIAAYVREHGAAFDRDALKDTLRAAIKAAPTREGRHIRRYLGDKWLDEMITFYAGRAPGQEFDVIEEAPQPALLPPVAERGQPAWIGGDIQAPSPKPRQWRYMSVSSTTGVDPSTLAVIILPDGRRVTGVSKPRGLIQDGQEPERLDPSTLFPDTAIVDLLYGSPPEFKTGRAMTRCLG